MGCITSRKEWPPQPRKRPVVRTEKRLVMEGGKWVSKLVQITDYTIDWPSLRCSGSSRSAMEDTSGYQENAIRNMED
jgi:hypothetical protein